MPISCDQALQQLHDWTKTPSLLGHARAVEIVMRAAASKYGGDREAWGITGLVHDADYERWPEEHPERIVHWLCEKGEDEIAYAVAFHHTKWGLPPTKPMDLALLACDELTGVVIACCLVRPDGITSLEPLIIKAQFQYTDFAIKVDRRAIRRSAENLDMDFDKLIQFVIDALRPHAHELGIGGKK